MQYLLCQSEEEIRKKTASGLVHIDGEPIDCSYQNLSNVDLSDHTRLPKVDFRGAHLSGADLSGAGFSGANLAGANLCNADLSEANLSGTNLKGAEIAAASFSAAVADRNTVWPDGFNPTNAGVVTFTL